MHTYIHTDVHTCIHSHMNIYTCTYCVFTRTSINRPIHTYLHTDLNTCIYMHTITHMYIHRCTYMYSQSICIWAATLATSRGNTSGKYTYVNACIHMPIRDENWNFIWVTKIFTHPHFKIVQSSSAFLSYFRCCAHILELEHSYFSLGNNQTNLPKLQQEAQVEPPVPSDTADDRSVHTAGSSCWYSSHTVKKCYFLY